MGIEALFSLIVVPWPRHMAHATSLDQSRLGHGRPGVCHAPPFESKSLVVAWDTKIRGCLLVYVGTYALFSLIVVPWPRHMAHATSLDRSKLGHGRPRGVPCPYIRVKITCCCLGHLDTGAVGSCFVGRGGPWSVPWLGLAPQTLLLPYIYI